MNHQFSTPPKNFQQSVSQKHLSIAFREMYLMIRALHLQTEPGSEENKKLLSFFEEIVQTQWVDEKPVEKLIIKGQLVILDLFGDPSPLTEKENIPPPQKNKIPPFKKQPLDKNNLTPPIGLERLPNPLFSQQERSRMLA